MRPLPLREPHMTRQVHALQALLEQQRHAAQKLPAVRMSPARKTQAAHGGNRAELSPQTQQRRIKRRHCQEH